jgi:hypothetical protein
MLLCMLNVILQNVIMLNVILLNVIMHNVVMLSVAAPHIRLTGVTTKKLFTALIYSETQ